MTGGVFDPLLQKLCEDLRQTWREAGGPTLRDLSAQVGLGKSQIGAIFNGTVRHLPNWAVVGALVGAVLHHARTHDRTARLSLRGGVDEYWRPRHAVLEHTFHDERRRQRTGSAGAPTNRAAARPAPPRRGGPAESTLPPRHLPPRHLPPRHLPPAIRSLSGRETELAILDRVATSAGICAVDGAAGVGKTTLAVFWAHRAAELFPDGQLYVNLRGFDPGGGALDPASVLRDLLGALGVFPRRIPDGPAALASLYRHTLGGRRVLLVLDNARDSDHVRPLLPGTPGCSTVVTSRSRLTGLVVAQGAHSLSLETLPAAAARNLLIDRLTPERVNADPVAADEIIARCAGLPLALAIVAAQAAGRPGQPLRGFAAGLRDSTNVLDALGGGEPDSDLRAVFSWSYRDLTPEAARLFRLLGLHPGPEVTAVAAASLTGVPTGRLRPALEELTRANLLSRPEPYRYTRHDLIGCYADELCRDIDPDHTRRAALHRMLDHYLHTAHAAVRVLYPHRHPIDLGRPEPGVVVDDSGGPATALDWFTKHRPVLSTLVEAAAAAGFDRHSWQLAWAVTDFLQRRGEWRTARTALDIGLAAARRDHDLTGQAHMHRFLGVIYTTLDRHDEALAHLRSTLDLFQRLDDRVNHAAAHLALGTLHVRLGLIDRALEHDQSALRLYQAAGHRPGQVLALNNTGWKHAQLGRYHHAVRYGEHALAVYAAAAGNRFGEADIWDTLGYAKHHLGSHEAAIECYEKALARFRDHGDRYHEAGTLSRIGDTHHAAGRPVAADAAWRAALLIFDHLDVPDAAPIRMKLNGSDPRRAEGPADHAANRI